MRSSSNDPIAIDLFAGVGGLSLGLEQAGFRVAVAVEKEPTHSEAHSYNFPNTPVLGDIEQVSASQIIELAGTDIDLLAGGPPCQGFSIEGKQSASDERNDLIWHFVRLVRDLRPKYFIFENVKALVTRKFTKLFEDLIKAFTDLGYVTLYKVVNAKHYGVPQSRERLIILGTRQGLSCPRFPKHHAVIPTVWEAISDLPEPESYTEDDLPVSYLKSTSSFYAASLREFRDFGTVSGFLKTKHSESVEARFLAATPGGKEPISRFHKLAAGGVSCTLKAGTGIERGSHTAARPIHPFVPRVITVREAARLHSFPDWFRFHPSKHWGFMEVGNSVPPLLAKAIAEQIIAVL